VLRGDGLSGDIEDTDPQNTGVAPLDPVARSTGAEGKKTVAVLKQWVAEAEKTLASHAPANGALLRGFATKPAWPQVADVYGVKAAAVAAYPMYRGVASLIGMEAIPVHDSVEEEFQAVAENWDKYDFFYVHIKRIDSFGEDGNWDGKVGLIEEVDRNLPLLMDLGPDVICVTGDHSTPCVMKSHSWHPVPTLLWSRLCRPDSSRSFGETACLGGALGPRLAAPDLMPIVLAHAGRLEKYGA
jgi:2,3-bisphosphoglycerate-independent phosphoglycerate mutase